MNIDAIVFKTAPARFTAWGKRLPYDLITLPETIKAGTAARLADYALRELSEAGFDVNGWACEVYTMDGDDAPADRSYTVEFINQKGGMVGVCGILTAKGWPSLNHGLIIDSGRTARAALGQPTEEGEKA